MGINFYYISLAESISDIFEKFSFFSIFSRHFCQNGVTKMSKKGKFLKDNEFSKANLTEIDTPYVKKEFHNFFKKSKIFSKGIDTQNAPKYQNLSSENPQFWADILTPTQIETPYKKRYQENFFLQKIEKKFFLSCLCCFLRIKINPARPVATFPKS